MTGITYVELFAGAGGLSRGLELAGWECLAHAEIEPHARAILRRHWPTTPLFGDVSALTGAQIHAATGGRAVTMLTGGSPCQDLSIAGKRAGMTEGSLTRSSLYFDQVRLWHELDAISPCPYFLWENVLGAFSSNNGRDFAAVLSALVGTPVPVPADGWKGGGGVVAGRTGVAAWRVLDCQFFGPPQRRRRIFVLGVRAGGVDPAEVLSLLESVSGHLESSDQAGQDAAPDAGAGAASGGSFEEYGHGRWRQSTVAGALRAEQGSGLYGGVVVDPVALNKNSGQQQTAIIAFDATFDPINITSKTNRSTVAPGQSNTLHGQGMCVASVYDARGNGAGSVDTTLPGDHLNRVTDYTPVVMRQREGKPGGGKGPMLGAESETLGTSNDQVVFTMASGQANAEVVRDGSPSLTAQHDGPPILFAVGGYADYTQSRPTLRASGGDLGGGSEGIGVSPSIAQGAHPGSYNGQDGPQIAAAILAAVPVSVRPRRLTPIECEKLMGWLPGWTERGIDEQGREYALSDSARYRAIGNGVASPVAGWIGWRLREALTPAS